MPNTLLPIKNQLVPPVSLTHEEIIEFKQIVKKVKDIDLTDEEAEDQATRMVKLVLLLRQKQLLDKRGEKG